MEENFHIVGGLFRDIYGIFKKYYSNDEDECLNFTKEYYRDALHTVLDEIIEYNKLKRKIIKEVKDEFTKNVWVVIINFVIKEVYYYKKVIDVVNSCISNYEIKGGYGDLELIVGILGTVMELNDQTVRNYNNISSWISEKGYDGSGLKIEYNLYEELKENIDDSIGRLTGFKNEELIKKRSM